MNIQKVLWVLRALIYKVTMKKVGMPSYIGKPLFIQNRCNISIGSKCRIYPGLRAELVNKNSFLTIGRNTSIGQNFHVVSYEDELIIGDNVTISGNVFITNCDHSYQNIDMHILDQPIISKKTYIGEGCFIGYGAVVQAGTILGKHCVIGANAVVRGVYPDYSVIVGVPARIIKCYDTSTKTWRKVDDAK